ncbi:hypothetical protein GCM10010313_54650 [Streptomyces violarus]|nr:hypothetical protein GCM10010313_54650 [Streptomyces violarus]
MNFWLLDRAVASPRQTVESDADLGVGAAFDVLAMTKAPPPATAAALTSSAIFFVVPRVLLRDMRAS